MPLVGDRRACFGASRISCGTQGSGLPADDDGVCCDDDAVTDEPDWFSLGGWSSRYARVAFSSLSGDYALVLIEANGDGREVGLNLLVRRHDRWEINEEYDDIGSDFAGRQQGYVWACGHDIPGNVLTVEYEGMRHDVLVSERGWWGYIQPARGSRDDADPPGRVTDVGALHV